MSSQPVGKDSHTQGSEKGFSDQHIHAANKHASSLRAHSGRPGVRGQALRLGEGRDGGGGASDGLVGVGDEAGAAEEVVGAEAGEEAGGAAGGEDVRGAGERLL